MARRLTTFSKFLIVLLVVGAAFFGFQYLQKSGIINGPDNSNSTKTTKNGIFDKKDKDVIKVGVVTWGGYAGGQYFNNGFAASESSRFYQDYGIKVEFVVNDDVDASLNAWKNGDIDLHWYTIDAFPTIVEGLSAFDPVVVWQSDWSRGGDAVVVKRGIRQVKDLKGKKIAVAELTPSHSFLLWLLKAGGMTIDDVQVIPQANAIDAASAFKSGQVDAAVVWSPDDQSCIRAVPGSRILESSRQASHIIADVFFAKREFAKSHADELQKLYEGWMRGAAEINTSAASKNKAIDILSEGLGIPREDAEVAIDNVRLVTHGDNKNFFGLNTMYKGVTGEKLYSDMKMEYQKLGFAGSGTPNWSRIAMPQFVQRTSALKGSEHLAEATKKFENVDTNAAKEKEAIATKGLSINFRSGEYKLDENAKTIIDDGFVGIAKAFGNSMIRIEGNTDNVGSRTSNVALSKKRAQSVADYLINEHGMEPSRFIIVGNGPDNPIANNNTAAGKAKNRRTDFQLIKE